ncbi:MlaD family protein [Aldersonia kunmingensis]|uniref:MlaD family protein n=1 Tax=Aldersonia kunmingensis TaxID=408066 RepID=UPI00082AF400|nr:MCE family protein [Aldersonia kunmingensis]
MIIDPSGRGPTMRQLVLAGIVFIAIGALLLTLLMMRYRGDFEEKLPVTALLTTTGDGLPADADVKYHGVLVGTVQDVEVAAQGEIQQVHINMDPKFIDGVPNTVTARVVPSNIFAVTSVEFIDNGPASPLQSGDEIQQDTSKQTIALQDTLTQVRNILDRIDPVKLGHVLGTLTTALEPGGRAAGSTIERLDRWLTAVDAAFPDLGADLQNIATAAAGVNESMPELIDALNSSITTANTISSQRDNLVALLASGGGAVDSINGLFAANPNAAKVLIPDLDETFGALASDPDSISQTMVNLNNSLSAMNSTFNWGPSQQMAWSMDLSFTPFKPYTRADCPRYGDMVGPSCFTAPIGQNPGVLPSELRPRRLESAGPAPELIPTPAAQAPAAPQAPVIPVPQLPGGLQLPQLPGLQLPPIPGITPASATVPAQGGIRGPAAVRALGGKKVNATQMMLIAAAMQGGALYPVSAASDGGAAK